MTSARRPFYELAKSRIIIRKRECHEAFNLEMLGERRRCSPAFAIVQHTTRERSYVQRWINALEISVDETFFDEKSADLMPYVIEHEIYELWLWSKMGYTPRDRETAHKLARRREVEMAMKDGKADKLRKFYTNIDLTVKNELDYAYQKAKSKLAVQKP